MKFGEFAMNDVFITEPITVRKEEMIEYAKKYDPQYLHLDEDAAKEGPFGSLIASGFFTMNVVWAEFIHMNILGREVLGGLGAEDIKWLKPVKPDDKLVGEYKVMDKRLLSDQQRGIVSFNTNIKNQDHVQVMTFTFDVLMAV